MKLARLAVVALAATGLLASGAALPAVAAPSKVVQVHFVGFCDGMELALPSAGLGTAGTIDGSQIGCDEGPVQGLAVPKKKQKYGLGKGTAYVNMQDSGLFVTYRPDQTFSIFIESGGVLFEGLTGTWAFGPPAADANRSAASAVSVDAARASDARPFVSPIATKEITFEGFCDGMRLTSPSAGTGVKGTVDGSLLGCESGFLMGTQDSVLGKKKTYAVEWSNSGGIPLFTAVMKDKTYVHYWNDGSGLAVVGAGTWVAGPPAAADAGLSASTR